MERDRPRIADCQLLVGCPGGRPPQDEIDEAIDDLPPANEYSAIALDSKRLTEPAHGPATGAHLDWPAGTSLEHQLPAEGGAVRGWLGTRGGL